MQHLTGALVFGQVAAESALSYMDNKVFHKCRTEQIVEIVQKELDAFRDNSSAQVLPHEFEYKVRRTINEYVASPKNHYKLNRAMELMQGFHQDLASKIIVNSTHDLGRALEIRSIIECAYLSAATSDARRESRWGDRHRRTDFPDCDDANWLKHIDVCRDDAFPSLKISFRAVE